MSVSYLASEHYGYNPVQSSQMYADSQGIDTSTIPGLQVAGSPTDWSSIGHNNPLFWLLILLLIFCGYLGFAFDMDVKRIVSAKIGVGSKG